MALWLGSVWEESEIERNINVHIFEHGVATWGICEAKMPKSKYEYTKLKHIVILS